MSIGEGISKEGCAKTLIFIALLAVVHLPLVVRKIFALIWLMPVESRLQCRRRDEVSGTGKN